jgi:uncharacterized repeat protein (TIGR03803 family)
VAAYLTLAGPVCAQTFNVLVNFNSTNGSSPQEPPVQGVDGNLYGVAFGGGRNGFGTVYRLTPSGTLSTLYDFCSQPNCSDGEFPFASIIPGADGNLYGLALNGGAAKYGTVFKLTLQGQLTTIYSFCSQTNCADGGFPNGLLVASDGNFYGTTMLGGDTDMGTIFKLTPQGKLSVLYDFDGDAYDVDESFGAFLEGSDGNFYGVTDLGGSFSGNCRVYGCGTAYKITPQGKFSFIHTFCSDRNCTDGITPYWLMQAADGDLYGVTGGGGSSGAIGGTVFRLTTKGKLTTLYNFCAQPNCTDGIEPIWLAQAAGGGSFYGATFRGGSSTQCGRSGCGTLFQISLDGTFESLHDFDASDGLNPYGLSQATNGTFYGVTSSGGTGNGTVFSLSTGLAPFLESLPTAGKVGTNVLILGTDLTGATELDFNGTSAKFKIISPTEIATVVPNAATTGLITVKTPSGTLQSNVAFTIKP